MTDLTARRIRLTDWWERADKAWLTIGFILLLLAILDPGEVWPSIRFAGAALAYTGIFVVVAVLAVGYLKASGAETLLAGAFVGGQARMIVMAALLGGLSPFCSCEVIPFVAALLAVGVPLSAVMAFWLSSPLMDPTMFVITAGTLGLEFALAKTVAAIGLGMFGGFSVMAMLGTALYSDPVKSPSARGGCGCRPTPFEGAPVWRFWRDAARRRVFRDAVLENALFLAKWLLLAYLIEALMLRYVPAEAIAGLLGGEGMRPVFMGAILGGPAYLNGYAAVPLMDALLDQGMSPGAAMAFVIAGGVSCIPAAIAVWALVKPRVFASYIAFAFTGSLVAGLLWNTVA
ncbi:MAG: permease [Pseudomonadota bacterium]